MSLQSLAKQFVELCNQGKNFDVMKTMYADDIVSVESSGQETAGKGPVIEKSKVWAGTLTLHGEKMRGPYFNGPDQFAVHTTFEVTPKATGQRVSQEEVAVYTVKGDKIVREQFFYEGKW
ncbi:MAG: nuclear transport factor 2 family protein [Planctomycetota bacterium]|nr:nuclear transport factor 2 family protein [Planctomycetota bacterium]